MRPADYLGIRDQSIAFYFDVECNEALSEFDQERFKERLEAAAMGGFNMPASQNREIGEITDSNFAERAF